MRPPKRCVRWVGEVGERCSLLYTSSGCTACRQCVLPRCRWRAVRGRRRDRAPKRRSLRFPHATSRSCRRAAADLPACRSVPGPPSTRPSRAYVRRVCRPNLRHRRQGIACSNSTAGPLRDKGAFSILFCLQIFSYYPPVFRVFCRFRQDRTFAIIPFRFPVTAPHGPQDSRARAFRLSRKDPRTGFSSAPSRR